jgi:hypothetical protein
VATLVVPRWDPDEPWPTLGPQICDLIEERFIFGPGSLQQQPAKLDDDKRAAIYSFYEVYPQGHPLAGRRRHKRCGYSVRKGLAKTELMAWISEAELHPEGPVRCDGFDANGDPVGRPVVSPYIPLLAVTVEQVEELAYGALYYMITEGPDADLFDATLERIIRLSPTGGDDGKAVPLSNSPGARDGARTTFQGFDEPHRLYLPRQKKAHETMLGNMSKRPLEDPWSLYVGTAGEPGQGSIAEDLHHEAEDIAAGAIEKPKLFYFARWAKGDHDLTTHEGRLAAVQEATGPVGEYGPGQFEDIASQWERKGADKQYLERVWLNRWTRSNEQAFDPNKRDPQKPGHLLVDDPIRPGSFVTAGFDGARRRDSTGIVITDIPTGRQKLWALWERDEDDPNWEVPEDEVTQSVEHLMKTHEVWRFNGDPPYWTETMGSWAGRWEQVEEWWTNRIKAMAYAVRAYTEAMDDGAVTFVNDDMEPKFAAHMAAAGKLPVNFWDDNEQQLYILRKLHPDRKFDAQMAAVLSWVARLDALKANAKPKKRRRGTKVKRLR